VVAAGGGDGVTDAGNVSSDTADAALTALAADLVEELAAGRALELAAGLADPPRSRGWRTLSPRQLGLAEAANPDLPATPDRPGHEDRRKHCEICGGTRGELVPGADGEDGYWACADERECEARKLHRYPPRPDLVPDAVLSAVGLADQQLLPREPAAAQQPEPESQQEPPESQQEGWQQRQGWVSSPFGAWDVNGQRHPALPRFDAYAHTLMNPVHRMHLLSGQARPHYYAGPNYVPPGMLSGAEPLEAAGGPQEGSGGTPAPEASEEELESRGLHEAARGGGKGTDLQLQQPELPEAAVQRPSRQRPKPDRYGRRRVLRYQGRR
jgi:hypothetical protein